jgi:hypothetical protein
MVSLSDTGKHLLPWHVIGWLPLNSPPVSGFMLFVGHLRFVTTFHQNWKMVLGQHRSNLPTRSSQISEFYFSHSVLLRYIPNALVIQNRENLNLKAQQ